MILIETQYWTKVSQHGFVSLNINLVKLHTRREQLRILMENVMIIVRDYNNIMNLISDKEKLLFKEHLASLDQDFRKGLQNLTWNAPADQFIQLARSSCHKTMQKIKSFQDKDRQIKEEYNKLSTTILTNVIKRMYKLPEFNEIQAKELDTKKEQFKNSFEKIRGHLI